MPAALCRIEPPQRNLTRPALSMLAKGMPGYFPQGLALIAPGCSTEFLKPDAYGVVGAKVRRRTLMRGCARWLRGIFCCKKYY
jgi:hypothetical protein